MIYIDNITEKHFSPAIRKYTELLLGRFLPIFDDSESEAERNENTTYTYDGEPDYDAFIGHQLMFLEMRTVFIAVGVSGLFHLFEKQLVRFLNHEIAHYDWVDAKTGKVTEYTIDSWQKAVECIKEFSFHDGSLDQTLYRALCSPDLTELREVSNAVKHGPGRALEKLKKMKAIVVDKDRLEQDVFTGQFSELGIPISIQPDDVIRYSNAILGFWKVRGRFSLPI